MNGMRTVALVVGTMASALPFSFLLWILYRLPQPLVRSHRKWPAMANFLLMVGVTVTTAIFFERATVRDHGLAGVLVEFLIAAGIYGFGLVLLLRQFCGVYEDFIITVGVGGLLLWKTSYTNIAKAETREAGGGERQIVIETARGGLLSLTLPPGDVERFYAQVRKKHAGE